jgi:hypothetical protein
MSTNKNCRLVLFDRFVKYVLTREDTVMLNLMATYHLIKHCCLEKKTTRENHVHIIRIPPDAPHRLTALEGSSTLSSGAKHTQERKKDTVPTETRGRCQKPSLRPSINWVEKPTLGEQPLSKDALCPSHTRLSWWRNVLLCTQHSDHRPRTTIEEECAMYEVFFIRAEYE